MPIFACTSCNTVENTALVDFWYRVHVEEKSALCSECLTGKWHGQFPRVQAVDYEPDPLQKHCIKPIRKEPAHD